MRLNKSKNLDKSKFFIKNIEKISENSAEESSKNYSICQEYQLAAIELELSS